ncbi:hypothetical protein LCGC14_2630500 [marine sediment metagenome]|uniref:Nucleoside 2-deoxyribosyltransferase n=1 Tax=marine sediment metagenome TaxID=412755 RepID=A0A0F9CSU2_9ZZZZ
MNQDWNNEVNSTFSVVTPPSLFFPSSGPKIFLAGSINMGKAPDWQGNVIKYIKETWTDCDVTVYNPRRAEEFTPEMEEEQVAWEACMLQNADFILMHLAAEGGVSPISLLELGLYMRNEKLYLSMDKDYPRRYVTSIHYALSGANIMSNFPNESIERMRNHWYN